MKKFRRPRTIDDTSCFLVSRMGVSKIEQKQGINNYRQDVENHYLYAQFRALEKSTKVKQSEKIQEVC